MDKEKSKQTKEPKIIFELGGVECIDCHSKKLILIGIIYFKKQIILKLFCDVCGLQNQFKLYQEEGEQKPQEDIRAISLKILEEKNKKRKPQSK